MRQPPDVPRPSRGPWSRLPWPLFATTMAALVVASACWWVLSHWPRPLLLVVLGALVATLVTPELLHGLGLTRPRRKP